MWHIALVRALRFVLGIMNISTYLFSSNTYLLLCGMYIKSTLLADYHGLLPQSTLLGNRPISRYLGPPYNLYFTRVSFFSFSFWYYFSQKQTFTFKLSRLEGMVDWLLGIFFLTSWTQFLVNFLAERVSFRRYTLLLFSLNIYQTFYCYIIFI